jgi:predicted DNA-binding transcriptional regulator AlpA
MLDKFYRKVAARDISGLGYTEFHAAMKDGRFPPPDAYIGPRSPVWTEATLRAWQQERLAAPKAPPATPRRRRRKAEDASGKTA